MSSGSLQSQRYTLCMCPVVCMSSTGTFIICRAQVVYNDRSKIEAMVKRGLPMMKNFKEFEFGFKIRDKTRPNDWYFAENITIIPPEDQLRGSVADQVSDWWKGITGGNKQ